MKGLIYRNKIQQIQFFVDNKTYIQYIQRSWIYLNKEVLNNNYFIDNKLLFNKFNKIKRYLYTNHVCYVPIYLKIEKLIRIINKVLLLIVVFVTTRLIKLIKFMIKIIKRILFILLLIYIKKLIHLINLFELIDVIKNLTLLDYLNLMHNNLLNSLILFILNITDNCIRLLNIFRKYLLTYNINNNLKDLALLALPLRSRVRLWRGIIKTWWILYTSYSKWITI